MNKQTVKVAAMAVLAILLTAGTGFAVQDVLENKAPAPLPYTLESIPTGDGAFPNYTAILSPGSSFNAEWQGFGVLMSIRVTYETGFGYLDALHQATVTFHGIDTDLCEENTVQFDDWFRTTDADTGEVVYAANSVDVSGFDHLPSGDRCYLRMGQNYNATVHLQVELDGEHRNGRVGSDGLVSLDLWDLDTTFEVKSA